MGTINRKIALEIIEGKYAEDRPVKIVTYNNMFDGGLTYAAVSEGENLWKYEDSPACSNVKTYWTKRDGKTPWAKTLDDLEAAMAKAVGPAGPQEIAS